MNEATTEEQLRAFDEGCRACRRGVGLSENPYPRRSGGLLHLGYAWELGWYSVRWDAPRGSDS